MFEEVNESLALMPDFMLDIEKTLLTSRQQKLEKWYNLKNLIDLQNMEINKMISQYSGIEKKEKEKREDICREMVNLKKNLSNKKMDEKILTNKILETKKLIENEDYNKPNNDELLVLSERIEAMKHDFNNKKERIIHDLEQFKMGLHYYKKFLQCKAFYVPEDQILLTFNQFAKTASEAHEFIKFKICDNATTFKFVEMCPKLKSERKMVERFHETGDIQGFVLHFWKSLKSLKLVS